MSELQGGNPNAKIGVQRYKGLGEMNPRATVGDHHEPTDEDHVESHSKGCRGLRQAIRDPHGGGCPGSKVVHRDACKGGDEP